MTTVSITMRTIARPHGVDYLSTTLGNLRRAGVMDDSRLVSFDIVDGGSPNPDNHLECVRSSDYTIQCHLPTYGSNGRPTPNEAATQAHVVANRHGSDFTFFMEDDIDVVDGFLDVALDWLQSHLDSFLPLYSLGANYNQIVTAVERGSDLWYYPVSAFYGTQCYVIHKAHHDILTRWLLDNPTYSDGKVAITRCHDLRLHTWAESVGARTFIASAPSLVQHIGRQSGMGCKFFQFESFPGHAS